MAISVVIEISFRRMKKFIDMKIEDYLINVRKSIIYIYIVYNIDIKISKSRNNFLCAFESVV